MKTEKLQLERIRYNPECEAFEALVRIHDAGVTLSYPVHIFAPLHADFAVVARGLTRKAKVLHQSRDCDLRLRQATTGQQPALAA